MFCGFCFKFIHLCMYLQTNKHFMCVKPMCMMTHQADELVVTKADCGVSSRRQRLGPKLSCHTKPTFDTRLPSSTSVLRLSRALVRQLNSQSEWSDADWPMSSDAAMSNLPKKSRRGPTSAHGAVHTEKTLSANEQKLSDGRPSAWCVLGLRLKLVC